MHTYNLTLPVLDTDYGVELTQLAHYLVVHRIDRQWKPTSVKFAVLQMDADTLPVLLVGLGSQTVVIRQDGRLGDQVDRRGTVLWVKWHAWSALPTTPF